MEPFWILLVCLLHRLLLGAISAYVAASKGYSGGFAWGFFLGVIGLLVVGFRPTLAQPAQLSASMAAPSRPKPSWICVCGAKNSDGLDVCLSCRRDRHEGEEAPKRVCPYCGAANRAANTCCFACGKPMDKASHPGVEAAEAAASVAEPVSIPALIEQLKQLHVHGVLTDEEFQQKKTELLRRL